MEGCVTHGTGKLINSVPENRVPGIKILGKTGTAQVPGKKNVAWFICFAPRENPEIALAVNIVGDTAGEELSGGRYAAPVASMIMKKYFAKKNQPARPVTSRLRSE
jgi:cell division protein FtsI/penicillin-binding protein 2